MPSDLLKLDKGLWYIYSSKGRMASSRLLCPPNQGLCRSLFDAHWQHGDQEIKRRQKRGLRLQAASPIKRKHYQVGVDRTLPTKASASSPTIDPKAFRAKVDEFKCTSGGILLTLRSGIPRLQACIRACCDGRSGCDSEQSLAVAQQLKSGGTEILTIGTDDADQDFLKAIGLAFRPQRQGRPGRTSAND